MYNKIQKIVGMILIVAIFLFVIIGLLAIWDIIDYQEVVWKTMMSLAFICFGLIITFGIVHYLGQK